MKNINYNQSIEERINRYVNTRLNENEVEQLWADLIASPYYYDYLKTAANVKYLLNQEKEKRTTIQRRTYWMAIAASIAITIGILSLVFQFNHSANNAIKPLDDLAFTNMRSAEIVNDTPQSQLQRGINFANSGKVSEAITLFTKIKEDNESAKVKSMADLNLGIVYYNQHDYSKAIQSFKEVLSTEKSDMLMKEKAYWFEGNAYLKMNDLQSAKTSIQKAYDLNGAYRRIAGKYLNEINKKLK